MVAGSSMGGLVSDFIAQTRSDRFGTAGIFSPAYWAAPNYTAARDAATARAVRRYLSMGTAESSTGESSSNVYWQQALNAYNTYVRLGHPLGKELHFDGTAGGTHSESSWSKNLPSFFAFALDPWLEAQPLSAESHPPRLELLSVSPATGRAAVRFTARYGLKNLLETNTDPGAGPGWISSSAPSATDLWNSQDLDVPFPVAARYFWRLKMSGWQ
jgi:hypothetical protein